MTVRVNRLSTTFSGSDVASLPTYRAPDLLNVAPWAFGLWAGDTLWTPPADGAKVSTWRDGTGGGKDVTQATSGNQPTYRASVAALNNKPAVEFTATAQNYLRQATLSVPAPYSIVAIAVHRGSGGSFVIGHSGSNNGYGMGISGFNGQWTLASGTGMTGGTPTRNVAHCQLGYTDTAGTAARVDIDGAAVVTGNAGATAVNQAVIGAGMTTGLVGAQWMDGYLAFLGIIAGDAKAASWWADFKSLVLGQYALTIA